MILQMFERMINLLSKKYSTLIIGLIAICTIIVGLTIDILGMFKMNSKENSSISLVKVEDGLKLIIFSGIVEG